MHVSGTGEETGIINWQLSDLSLKEEGASAGNSMHPRFKPFTLRTEI